MERARAGPSIDVVTVMHLQPTLRSSWLPEPGFLRAILGTSRPERRPSAPPYSHDNQPGYAHAR